MFRSIIRFSLEHRLLVLVAASVLLVLGGYQLLRLPIDVLPDLNRPRVTVMTECPGMAPEEVETLVTTPLESTLAGATGVIAIRSSSTVGLSIVTVEFDWGIDPYRSRQVIAERLASTAERLPEGIVPQMTPISSVMGQILLLGVWSDDPNLSPIRLRTVADWTIRKRLLGVPGVAEVFVMGGGRKQFQVLVDTDDLLKFGVELHEIEIALGESNQNVTGGYLTGRGDDQYLVRSLGRIQTVEDLENLVVKSRPGSPILLKQVARVVEAPAVKVGDSSAYVRGEDGSFSGGPAVVLTIEKQPDVDTRKLTDTILETVESLQASLEKNYPGLRIAPLYRQSQFIDLAIANVIEALWIGAILVMLALVLFLNNLRTTCITLLAMPLSFVVAGLTFAWFGLSINTMTLGGLAVAMGELVDDAIVDVENIFRRLRENRLRANPLSPLRVVFEASSEIRNSIVNGTVIVVLVFLPLFFLSGIEGRLFRPLGIAYVVSILSSLVVSLTVTPVLSYLLLSGRSTETKERQGFLFVFAQKLAGGAIRLSLAMPRTILTLAAVLAIGSGVLFFQLDRNFMPPFNEGSIQLNVDLMPGKSLETSGVLADRLAEAIQQVDGIETIVRKTGRAELDEHAVGVNTSEVICTVDPNTTRSIEEITDELEALVSPENLPGTVAFSDQPLQHLINHLRSGTQARIAVKLRGDDLKKLRRRAETIRSEMQQVDGVGRVRIDPIQVDIPQIRIRLDRAKLAFHGLTPYQVNELVETAMNGRVVTEVIENQAFFEVLLRLNEACREDLEALEQLPIPHPDGGVIPLKAVATIDARARGPHQIDHEDGRRQVLIQSNPKNRGAVDVKEEIQQRLASQWEPLTEGNYSITFAGLFESERQASRVIGWLSLVALAGVFLVLYHMFRSANLALEIMAALPMALIGAVAAMLLTGQDRTVPNLVGMISLCGIASRNGILLLDHYFHLVRYEGHDWSREMILHAGQNRTAPVLMTAITSACGLIPLTLAAGEPGREILYPIATVVVGGLISSTLMEFFVRPALFWTCGRKAAQRALVRWAAQEEERLVPLENEKE